MIFWLGWFLFASVFIWTVPSILALYRKQLRPCGNPDAASRLNQTLVSVIVPARNEAQQIEKSLRSILQTEGIRIELIAINDRSEDGTGVIMDQLAAAEPRLKVIHIADLPSGWLGKNHAMHLGAQHASGSLLLFTDGDVIYQSTAIATAVTYLTQQRLQHLCLLPRMIPGGTLENSVVAFFGLMFAIGMQLHLIRTRWPFAYAGVGAFNLIDADFYRRIGGHRPIAMDVLDDVKLGKMVKRNGGFQDFLSAPEFLSIRWQPSLWGVVKGLEKNGFASLNYSLWQMGIVTILFFVGMVSPFLVTLMSLAGQADWRSAGGFLATGVLWHISYGAAAALAGVGWRLTPLFPFAAIVMAFAFWRSAYITLRQGGVRWRDSFYSLAELRPAIFR